MISEGVGGGFDLIKLPYVLYVFEKTVLSQQCRPSSDATERRTRRLIKVNTVCLSSSNFNRIISSKIVEEKYKVKNKGCEYLG